MSEAVTTTVAPKTAKPAKAKATPAPKTGLTLRKPHKQVLGTLKAKKKPMTRREIADVVGKKDTLHGGRIANESATYAELVTAKMIKETEIGAAGARDDLKQTVYEIMAAGIKAFDAAK